MHRLIHSIKINASKEDVWRTLLEDSTYRQWSSVFEPGSYAVTDWEEGSKALFLTPAGNGMVSMIVTHRPNQFLSIQHKGTVKDGVEDLQSVEAKEWAGALENYSLQESNGACSLRIEMDVADKYRTYFEEQWPRALERLRDLAELKRQSELENVWQSA